MKTKNFLLIIWSYLLLFNYFLIAQNPGEIIFSKQVLDPLKSNSSINNFSAGDKIYSIAYFQNSISALSNSPASKRIMIEIFLYELKQPLYSYQQPMEEQLEFSNLYISGDALNQKYLVLDIVPSDESNTSYGDKNLTYEKFGKEFYGPVKFAKALSKLSPGEHTIIVKVNINYATAAEGRFIINGNDFNSYANLAEMLNESAANLKMRDAVLPKAQLVDKKLESDLIAALKKSQTYKERIIGDIVKLVIIDPDWTIRRNEFTGAILHRYIRATAAVKNADGTCTVWQLITFQQDYIGNKFGPTKFDGVGDPYKIPCENISN